MDTKDVNTGGVAPSGSVSRRRFLGGAVAAGASGVALSSLLAACSGGGGSFSGGGSATNAKKFHGKLTVGIIQYPPPSAQKALTAAYKKHQPGVDLVWNVRNWADQDNYVPWLGTQLAAGNIDLDIVSGNYQANFTNYVNFDEYKTTKNPYTGNPWEKDLNFDFFIARNGSGSRYLVATQEIQTTWYYNEEMFDKANVKPPTTWDELVEVCEKLKAAGMTPVASNFAYIVPQWLACVYFDQYHVDWVNTVRAQKGDWDYIPSIDGKFTFNAQDEFIHEKYTYNAQRFWQGIQNGTLRFDTPAVEDMVTNFAKVFPKYANTDFYVVADPYSIFLQQNAAMMYYASNGTAELVSDLAQLTPARIKALKLPENTSVKPFKWSTFDNPPMKGSSIQTARPRTVNTAAGEYISIVHKNAQQVEMALDFVMFWLSKVGYKPYLEAYEKTGLFTPSGPVEISGVSYPPKLQKQESAFKVHGNSQVNYNGFWTGGAGPDQQTDQNGLYRSVLDGDITPAQYGTQLQQYITSHLSQSLSLSSLTEQDIQDPARRPAGS